MERHDHVALITGGARGVGAATAEAIARSGATVVVADLDLESAAEVAANLAGGGRTAPSDSTFANRSSGSRSGSRSRRTSGVSTSPTSTPA